MQAEIDPDQAGTLPSEAQIGEIENRLADPGRRLTLDEAEALVKKRGI